MYQVSLSALSGSHESIEKQYIHHLKNYIIQYGIQKSYSHPYKSISNHKPVCNDNIIVCNKKWRLVEKPPTVVSLVAKNQHKPTNLT